RGVELKCRESCPREGFPQSLGACRQARLGMVGLILHRRFSSWLSLVIIALNATEPFAGSEDSRGCSRDLLGKMRSIRSQRSCSFDRGAARFWRAVVGREGVPRRCCHRHVSAAGILATALPGRQPDYAVGIPPRWGGASSIGRGVLGPGTPGRKV